MLRRSESTRHRLDFDAAASSRQRMLERALWALWLALSVALITMVRDALGTERWPVVAAIACAWIIVAVASAWRTLDLRLRGLGLYLALLIACVACVTYSAYHGPNGYLGLLVASVLLALGLGARAGWLALVASTLLLVVIAGFVRELAADRDGRCLLDVRDPGNWARVIVIFVGLTSAVVACTSYLTARLERAMHRSHSLLDALAVESQQRIDALKREHELCRQLERAQKLEAVGTLAGGVAHDFNNLLLVIIAHAGLLRSRPASGPRELDTSLQAIEDAAQRAADLTRQLLAFGRRDVGAPRSFFDLNAGVTRSLALIRSLLPPTIDLRFSGSAAALPVFGAQVELDQIVMNLCVNARDAMPAGGTIEVSTSLTTRDGPSGPRPHACMTVRDTGSGMSLLQQQRMFDPFYTTKPAERGTGLGLSVVHGIVTHWKGRIEVTSELGRGTELRVHVPCADPGEQPAARATAGRRAAGGSETVLLVDDDARVCAVTRVILAEAGYRVIACADGIEALDRFRATPDAIDLVITDVMMPHMNGLELHDATAVDRPELPYLVCSGYAADAVTPDVIVPLRREFLSKPYTGDELLIRVRRLLDAPAPTRHETARDVVPVFDASSDRRASLGGGTGAVTRSTAK